MFCLEKIDFLMEINPDKLHLFRLFKLYSHKPNKTIPAETGKVSDEGLVLVFNFSEYCMIRF